jgi:hypothetical protein
MPRLAAGHVEAAIRTDSLVQGKISFPTTHFFLCAAICSMIPCHIKANHQAIFQDIPRLCFNPEKTSIANDPVCLWFSLL